MENRGKSSEVCLFCCKTIDSVDHGVVHNFNGNSIDIMNRFIDVLERFCGFNKNVSVSVNDIGENLSKLVGCCGTCVVMIDSFCNNFHKLKCLEMEMEWKLKHLLGVMELAGRVPSRFKKLQNSFECSQSNIFSSMATSKPEYLACLKKYRQQIIKICSSRLKRSQPRVLLRRNSNDADFTAKPSKCYRFSSAECDDGIDAIVSATAQEEEIADIVKVEVNTNEFMKDEVDAGISGDDIAAAEPSEENVSDYKDNMQYNSSNTDFSDQDDKSSNSLGKSNASNNERSPTQVITSPGKTKVASRPKGRIRKSPGESTLLVRYPCADAECGCDKTFSTKRYAVEHRVRMWRNVNDPSLVCDICKSWFTTKASLNYHKMHVHENRTVVIDRIIKSVDAITRKECYTCTVTGCGMKFTRKWTIREHQQRKHGIGKDLSVTCDLCGKRLSWKSRLANHKRTVHSSNRLDLARCDVCNEEIEKEQLLEHVRAHVGEEYVIKCPNPTCLHVFSQSSSLTKHLVRFRTCSHSLSPADRPTKMTAVCEFCGFTSPLGYRLRDHLLKNHENDTKNFACPVSGCEKCFTVRQSLVLHLPLHDFCSGFTYQRCPVCNEHTQLDKMKEHLTDKHQVPEIIKCKQCSFLFSSREQLLEHLLDHRFGEMKCDICEDGVKYSRHADLRVHYFTVHKIGVKYSCEHCHGIFWTKEKLSAHLQEHKGHYPSKNLQGDDKPFGCEECKLVYKTEASLTEHKIVVHGAEPFSCLICYEKFNSKSSLRRHSSVHKGVGTGSNVKFICEVEGCGKVFNFKVRLIRHMRAVHLPIKNVCEFCGKSFPEKSELKVHKDAVHLRLRPFVCEVCGKSFPAARNLRLHKAIHSREKVEKPAKRTKFDCEVEGCGKIFSQKKLLKRHHQVTHMGVKHVCELCGKSYADIVNLRDHRDFVHLGLRHYVCEVCGESFGSGVVLKKHKRIHTGERPFECKFCGQRFRHKQTLNTHLDAHQRKGSDFKPNGPMKHVRKRVERKTQPK